MDKPRKQDECAAFVARNEIGVNRAGPSLRARIKVAMRKKTRMQVRCTEYGVRVYGVREGLERSGASKYSMYYDCVVIAQ